MNTGAKGCDHSLDLFVCINLVQTGFLYVQYFSTKRKDSLCSTVTSCLRRATRGTTIYDIDSQFSWILVRAIGQGLPGRDILSRADFLLVRSRALRAASLALWASTDFSTVALATAGFCSRKISSCLLTTRLQLLWPHCCQVSASSGLQTADCQF